MSVVIQNLVKSYGSQRAVDDISFEASSGSITGFLGPNGAGKSTTMKIAAGYIDATAGDVMVNGVSVTDDPYHARKSIGYLPEHNPLYVDMYVKEFLQFIAKAYKVRKAKSRIVEVIEMVGLAREQHKKIKALSKGYRQRVGLAQALLPDPKVLILDEPTTGLDPNQLQDIRKLIKDISANKTVILSTHIMQEVEAVCDQVVIINKGKIVANDAMSSLSKKSAMKDVWELEFEKDVDHKILESIKGVESLEVLGGGRYRMVSAEDVKSEVLRLAAEHNWPLVTMRAAGGSLEDVFRDLTTKEDV